MANQVVSNTIKVLLVRIDAQFKFKTTEYNTLTTFTICDFQLMMVSLSTCVLVFWIAATQPREGLACEQIRFLKSDQKYLANHVMETKQADSECFLLRKK